MHIDRHAHMNNVLFKQRDCLTYTSLEEAICTNTYCKKAINSFCNFIAFANPSLLVNKRKPRVY